MNYEILIQFCLYFLQALIKWNAPDLKGMPYKRTEVNFQPPVKEILYCIFKVMTATHSSRPGVCKDRQLLTMAIDGVIHSPP